MLFSCQYDSTSEFEVDPIAELETVSSRSDSEYTEIGQMIDGVFELTVTEDQLQSNFALNAEHNLGVSGVLTEAFVALPNEENGLDTPLFVMRGDLDNGGSAEFNEDVILALGPEGITFGRIRKLSEIGLICMGDCTKCVSYTSNGANDCKCIQSGGGSVPANDCKKTVPYYQWDFNPPSEL